MKAWQAMEENIARLLNGKRVIRTQYSASDVDVVTDDFIVECKSRREMPALIRHAWEQVLKYTHKYPHKIPLVAIHQSRKRGYGKYFIVIEINDFIDILRRVNDRNNSKQ